LDRFRGAYGHVGDGGPGQPDPRAVREPEVSRLCGEVHCALKAIRPPGKASMLSSPEGGVLDGMVATVAGVGFVLGLRPALDPDHVVAVSTLASQKIGLRRTSLVGACWGLGHALSLGLAGGVILALRLTVP